MFADGVSRKAKPEHNFHQPQHQPPPWTKTWEWKNRTIQVNVQLSVGILSQNFAELENESWLNCTKSQLFQISKRKTRNGLLGTDTATDQTKPFNTEVSPRKFQRQPQEENSTIRSITDQTKSPKSSYTSRGARMEQTFHWSQHQSQPWLSHMHCCLSLNIRPSLISTLLRLSYITRLSNLSWKKVSRSLLSSIHILPNKSCIFFW